MDSMLALRSVVPMSDLDMLLAEIDAEIRAAGSDAVQWARGVKTWLRAESIRVRLRVPSEIRQTHPGGFRSGQWARLLTTVESRDRDCWVVQFEDGATDWWPKDDPLAGYEFR